MRRRRHKESGNGMDRKSTGIEEREGALWLRCQHFAVDSLTSFFLLSDEDRKLAHVLLGGRVKSCKYTEIKALQQVPGEIFLK